ncbi:MAG TPA: asparaginase domain-containing protein [Candidatus Absconditabacterales bacterium]|nr:asparaginase domain-containing protein [Candidatus Absconditabacterales bacterium]
MTMTIKFIITGGTIDDLEYEFEKDAPQKHKSLVPDLLRQSKITLKYSIDELLQKDSRHINNKDRELVYKRCLECSEDKIIITHGTMKMPATAKYLGQKNIPKTIVLLGAMIPANKENSDALFNIGAALSSVQLLPHGVYITMNGKIFLWNNVKKNLDKGIFETEK